MLLMLTLEEIQDILGKMWEVGETETSYRLHDLLESKKVELVIVKDYDTTDFEVYSNLDVAQVDLSVYKEGLDDNDDIKDAKEGLNYIC